jgi:hypothetical protein
LATPRRAIIRRSNTSAAANSDATTYIFDAGLGGPKNDLDKFGQDLPDKARRERELNIFKQLIGAVQGEPIEHDDEMLSMPAETAQSFDRPNEHRRVIMEDDALHSVIAQLSDEAEMR